MFEHPQAQGDTQLSYLR